MTTVTAGSLREGDRFRVGPGGRTLTAAGDPLQTRDAYTGPSLTVPVLEGAPVVVAWNAYVELISPDA